MRSFRKSVVFLLNGNHGLKVWVRGVLFSPLECSEKAEDFLEGFSELGIEYRVNNRIHDAVHVPQPSGEHEGRGTDATVGFLHLDADRVDDVAREERRPRDQENTYRADAINLTDSSAS